MKTFTFNLLPQKPKEQVAKEEDRDRSSVYTALLPLLGVVIWLGLVMFNGLVVNKVEANWQASVDSKNATIQSQYTSTLVAHGEYVQKTQALVQPVAKDIKPEKVFQLAEELFPTPEAGITINAYERLKDGTFNIGMLVDEVSKVAGIVRRFSNFTKIKDVKLNSVIYDKEKKLYQASVNFTFKDIEVTPTATPVPAVTQ